MATLRSAKICTLLSVFSTWFLCLKNLLNTNVDLKFLTAPLQRHLVNKNCVLQQCTPLSVFVEHGTVGIQPDLGLLAREHSTLNSYETYLVAIVYAILNLCATKMEVDCSICIMHLAVCLVKHNVANGRGFVFCVIKLGIIT